MIPGQVVYVTRKFIKSSFNNAGVGRIVARAIDIVIERLDRMFSDNEMVSRDDLDAYLSRVIEKSLERALTAGRKTIKEEDVVFPPKEEE